MIKFLHDWDSHLFVIFVDMNELDFITDSFAALHNLKKKDIIFLDDVQKEFSPDLQTFIMGETMSVREGRIVIGNNLYKRWLDKIRTKGFDEEIDFKPAIISLQQSLLVAKSEADNENP